MKNRLFAERPLPRDGNVPKAGRKGRRPARTVTVNLTESPLGWLKARGLVSARQYEAGEKLRGDWERAALGPRVTMCWDAPPADKNARGPEEAQAPTLVQAAARRRFEAAVKAVGRGMDEVLWRVVCAGEGMRDVEQALGWPARAGKLVLGFALDRLADHYRIR
jgi:hypothetical protein